MNEEQHHPSDRRKELSRELEQQFGHLEQQPPNKPSFLLVVLIAAAVIIVVFITAWVVIRWGGGAHFLSHAHRKAPTSQLVLPIHAPFAPRSSAG
jgi:hypothetical protein